MTVEAGFLNTPELQQAAIDTRAAIVNAAQVGTIGANQFTFFAAFDGTNNDAIASNGDPQTTNVHQLFLQARKLINGVRHDLFLITAIKYRTNLV